MTPAKILAKYQILFKPKTQSTRVNQFVTQNCESYTLASDRAEDISAVQYTKLALDTFEPTDTRKTFQANVIHECLQAT